MKPYERRLVPPARRLDVRFRGPHGRAKLPRDDAEVLRLWEELGFNGAALGRMFGCTPATVSLRLQEIRGTGEGNRRPTRKKHLLVRQAENEERARRASAGEPSPRMAIPSRDVM